MSDLPSNEEIERRSLSALMHGAAEVQAAVAEGLVADAFYHEGHSAIFSAMCRCAAIGQETDSAAIWRQMSGLHGTTPSISVLAALDGLEPTSARRRKLTNDVLALWRQRRLIVHLREAIGQAIKNAPSWEDVWERVKPHMTEAHDTSNGVAMRDVAAMRDEAKRMIVEPDGKSFPGPFRGWDIDSKPLRAGQLVVLAGRPGTGKTALALHYLAATLKTGRDAVIFSLEMSGEELLHRMAHQAARSGEKNALLSALDGVPTKNLHIFEARDHASMAQIEARARLLAVGGNVGLVIVDYLGLVKPPDSTKRDHRERQVAEMSRSFKLLAGDIGCPLMLLHQLNRESERDQRKPRLSDLRESGAIEQDADVVWLLWEKPPESAYEASSKTAEVHLIQAKRRNGQPNIYTKLLFDRPILTFTQIAD